MIPFYLLPVIPLIAYYQASQTKLRERKNEVAVGVFFLLLFFLLALRSESVGSDTPAYQYYFDTIAAENFSEIFSHQIEGGYALLNKAVSLFTDNFQIFLTVTAAICVFPIYFVYKRNVKNAGLTIILFMNMSVFVMLFSGIRQATAISLGLLAFNFMQNKKPLFFIITVFIAMTVHQSAFVLFLLYPVYRIKIEKPAFFAAVPVLAALLFFRNETLGLLVRILPGRYQGVTFSSTGAYSTIILFGLFVIYSYLIPDKEKIDEKTRGLRNILCLAFVFQFFSLIHPLAMRMNYYFIIFIPLVIPEIIDKAKDSLKNIVFVSKAVMLLFFAFYFFYGAYGSSGGLNVFPYSFFWENIL